jgi:hypothetical protein
MANPMWNYGSPESTKKGASWNGHDDPENGTMTGTAARWIQPPA